ncbi:MAG: tRNA uridine-5-carboxymethylaminomethyl(34) synthesis enzyme MnmG [Candidatus Dadabacteria bacterium]|nr:tRNA uridine-5-carboxymethylaminomethyl(34) synthesis enzyme MnmG [Candidatus Dadabacteria bacterium]
MSLISSKKYQVIVIGAGHAGCEAALAAARMGCRTLVLTANIDTIGLMSCNPSIGGVGKGHLVKEIDALGGEMGKAADTCAIQFRRLNTRKGAAVQATRIQADRQSYKAYMKKTLENESNIEIKQAMVERFLIDGKKVAGVSTALGEKFFSDTVVVTPGTFPGGLIHIGLTRISSGRAGEAAAGAISNSFADLGFTTGRLKTGTPPRFDGRTIEWDRLERQEGDEDPVPFSFSTGEITTDQIPCYVTYTNEETHRVINENIDKSPLYSGLIKGIGPRYCPSIEDKVVKFPDRDRHQVFLEPEGKNTYEIYPNGISTSLPIEVQYQFSRTMEGLQNVEIMRPGYAVEYDFLDPTQLGATLESKLLANIFLAGQVNGTTGYEEAASQGLMAGINAALQIKGKNPLVLTRSEAYIGILIDDLVTQGVDEPYRMFTSRAEYRLILREDNADLRLGELGHSIGLLCDEQIKQFRARKTALEKELERLENEKVFPNEKTNRILDNLGSQKIRKPQSLKEILRRPGFTYEMLGFIDSLGNPQISPKLGAQIEMEVKYEGYIKRQKEEVGKLRKFENMKIPEEFEYGNVPGLSNEIVQKLSRIKPESVGQASRVSGITPAAISVLLVHIRKTQGSEQEAQLKSSSPS